MSSVTKQMTSFMEGQVDPHNSQVRKLVSNQGSGREETPELSHITP
jgi:hypothetical protein